MKQNILIPTPGSIVDYCVVMGPVKRVKITSVSKNAYNSYIARYIDEKGKSGGVNCRHIIRIVKYSKQIPRKYNYYAKTYSKHGREGGFVNHTKRSYCGPLTEIASIILSNHNVPVKTPIDSNKLHELYYKNSEGLVDSGQSSYYPIVSKKCFKKWVLKNYTGFLGGEVEWNAEIAEREKEYEEAYYAAFDAQMDEDFYADLDKY